jgi:hypothetical protein
MSQTAAAAARSALSTFKPRPFRVKLRGSILALMKLPNKREVRAKIHQISITGGLLNVDQPLDEKLQVELIFQLGENPVREKAEMLFPMWATHGWLQPFKFIDLPEDNRNILEQNLLAFVQQSQSTQAQVQPKSSAEPAV